MGKGGSADVGCCGLVHVRGAGYERGGYLYVAGG